MAAESAYLAYTKVALDEYDGYTAAQKNMLVEAAGARRIEKVLDVGCGAGQQLLPFAAAKDAFCVGIDVGEEVGAVGGALFRRHGLEKRGAFLRARGERLPFADASFDVVICRVALPYMDNRAALAEMARVLRPAGRFFLKTHAPCFYFWLLRRRLPLLSAKQLAYPLICLAGGTLNLVTGRHPRGGFWEGKEVYQTRGFLEKELARHGLRIAGELADTNRATPSFVIEKQQGGGLAARQ